MAGFGRALSVVGGLLLVLVGVGAGAVPVQRSASAARAPEPAVLRVMPLGASSTVGEGSPDTEGYRGPLQAMLARDGVTVDMVGSRHGGAASVRDHDYEGYGGMTLADLLPRVAGLVRRADPDVVLLHAGTNDLLKGASAEEAARRLDKVLTEIIAVRDVHVIVAGVWAPLKRDVRDRAEFERLAATVVADYRGCGHSVRYADTSDLLRSDELADGLHPNAAGYREIAAMWEREILAVTGRRSGS